MEYELDGHARCLQAVAHQRGIRTELVVGAKSAADPIMRAWLKLDVGGRDYFYANGVLLDGARRLGKVPGFPVNGRASRTTSDKAATKAVLAAIGLSVPHGEFFDRADRAAALDFAASLGTPVCIKPNTGKEGILAFPNLTSPAAMARAFSRVAEEHAGVIVEQNVPGQELRCFFVESKVVGQILTRPPRVIGDGQSSIAKLIERRNDLLAQRRLLSHFPITLDDNLLETLDEQGLAPATVLEPGRLVWLRHQSSRKFGGEAISSGSYIHPSYARIVEAACAAIPGLLVAAIDMKVRNPAEPADAGNYWILEVNSAPGLVAYHQPWEGPPQNVGGSVLDFLSAFDDEIYKRWLLKPGGQRSFG